MRTDLVQCAGIVGLAKVPAWYRVRFWAAKPEPGFARALEEWDVSEFDDFLDVYRWAETTASGRDFEIFAVVVEPEGTSHVRISGSDGDSDSGTSLTIVFSKEP